MEVTKGSDEAGCGTTIGALFILAAIYAGAGLLLQYVLGGFGVHISYPLALATAVAAKYFTPSR